MVKRKIGELLLDAQIKFKNKNPGKVMTKCVVPKKMLQYLVEIKDADLYNMRIWGFKLEVSDKLEDPIWE